MLVDKILVRPQGQNEISISWTSETAAMKSWIFLNGLFLVGPFMAEQKERSATLPVATSSTFKLEIHDFIDDEIVPQSIEQTPLVRPQIAWNEVNNAVSYKIYHTIFDAGSIESLLTQVPSRSVPRMEMDCPARLEGKNGRWHSFRVEAVDQFGNESINDIVPHFAIDFPPVPKFVVSRDTKTKLLTFRISLES
ncbi:MAG: hypothetical protein LBT05_14930 [Planctomycetaceae bacterium]|jgi:hypothetical protein|nr:hypothetical protein [Planctomycetaceae bacterium]